MMPLLSMRARRSPIARSQGQVAFPQSEGKRAPVQPRQEGGRAADFGGKPGRDERLRDAEIEATQAQARREFVCAGDDRHPRARLAQAL